MATIVDIYCRVSTDPQEDNTSLDEQEAICRQFCREKGWGIGEVHREIFSGFMYRERPKLSRMRDRYREGKVQAVVVRTLDRLSRKQVHAGIIMEEMEHYHVSFDCVTEPINTEDRAMAHFIRMVFAFVAEMEREKIMDRTMSGRISTAKQGAFREGPKPLYGYKWHDEITKDYRVIDEIPAGVCLWIHEQFDTGKGPRALLRELLVSNPERKWTRGAIHQILSDSRRTGKGAKAFTRHAPDAKKPFEAVELPEGTYPEIIPPELFERNQARLSVNRAESSRQSKDPERFLLRAGYIKCDICNYNMYVNASKNFKTPLYFCGENDHSNTVNTKKIDTLAWDYMVQLADKVELIEQAIELATNNAGSIREIAAIERSIANSQAKVAQYTEDLSNSTLKGTARSVILKLLSDESANLENKQEEKNLIQSGIVDMERLRAEADKILAWCKSVKEARGELSYQEKRDFMRLLGIRVFIGKSDKRYEDLIWRIEADLPEIQELIMSTTHKKEHTASVMHLSTCYP